MNQPATQVIPTDQSRFADVEFAQRYPATWIEWPGDGLAGPARLAVVDAAPAASTPAGTFVLLHGEPSWSVLYEQWIPRLTAAGYRCVAIDLPGFGRSDKPVDDEWYSYERHCAAVAHVIDTLDLTDIRLVVQDWAGPIGLRYAVDHPARFARLFVFNTWLHHSDFEYSTGVRWWRDAATDPTKLGGDMPTGAIVLSSMRRQHPDTDHVQRLFDAPFTTYESKAGARAFPTMIPFGQPERGGAVEQERCHQALLAWDHCPVHIAFGDGDIVFTFDQAERWASQIPNATLDRIPDAGHFVQYDAPDDCLAVIARYEQRAI